MNMPSKLQLTAFGRHVISYSMGAITFLAITHAISSDQAQNATNAITQISTGFASIVAGVTTLVSLISGLWAASSASLKAQIAAVQAAPQAQVTVTDPKLAEGVPGVKVAGK